MGRPLQHRRRVTIALVAALALDVGFAVLTTVPAGAAGAASAPVSAGVAKKAAATASLHIEKPNVSVRRKGKTVFKPAKEAQKLRVGDTIQTDATGLAQINYTEGSFTRLDVSTTFTIVSLTDDQGHRQVNGSLDSGRTWNRTTALTESESFQQQGGGATAAVVGSAFMMQCDASGHCSLISVVDGLRYSTVDGELKLLDPLQECDSTEIDPTNTDLCANPTPLTLDAFLANQWILDNLFLDGLAGFPGPDISGLITVNNGVVTFTPTPPPPPPNNNPPATPPVIDPNNPIVCDGGCTPAEATAAAFTPGDSIHTTDGGGGNVDFVANLSFTPTGQVFIVFTKLPDAVGTVHTPGTGGGSVGSADVDPTLVQTGQQYLAGTVFTFVPNDVGNPATPVFLGGLSAQDTCSAGTCTDTMIFHAVGGGGSSADTAPIDVKVDDTDPPVCDLNAQVC